MRPTALNPYMVWVKVAGLAACLCGAAYLGYDYKAGKCAEAENARLKAVEAQRDEWQRVAYETDEQLRKALARIPRTGSKVDEAVRAHPTSPDCRVPDDVADRLHEGIAAGEASTSE